MDEEEVVIKEECMDFEEANLDDLERKQFDYDNFQSTEDLKCEDPLGNYEGPFATNNKDPLDDSRLTEDSGLDKSNPLSGTSVNGETESVSTTPSDKTGHGDQEPVAGKRPPSVPKTSNPGRERRKSSPSSGKVVSSTKDNSNGSGNARGLRVIPFYPSFKNTPSDDEPSDEVLHCHECSRDYEGDCPKHGRLRIIMDTPVRITSNDKFRAHKTVPPEVSLFNPHGPDSATGAWARETIPARTRFGPYEGKFVPPETSTAYSWLVQKKQRPSHRVDASDPGLSNWMRFVNCARTDGEQNLVAFQYQGQIYYRTLRQVNPQEELLVWRAGENGVYRGGGSGAGTNLEASSAEDEATLEGPKPGTTPIGLTQMEHARTPFVEETAINIVKVETVEKDSCDEANFSDGTGEALACTECDERFSNEETLASHQLTHVGQNPFRCGVCSERFLDKEAWTSHLITHAGKRTFMCRLCSRRFTDKERLLRHQREHTERSLVACTECDEKFLEMAALKQHQRSHASNLTRNFLCDSCNKRFKSKATLTRHRRRDHGTSPLPVVRDDTLPMPATTGDQTPNVDKPFACAKCEKRFSKLAYVRNHYRVHEEQKPFVCTECGEQFSRESNFNAHLVTHGAIKPFACTECDQRFIKRRYMRAHVQAQHGGKPFACTECDQRFGLSSALKAHQQTHTEEKPFACAECDQRFTLLKYLNAHQKTHDQERPFACSLCKKRFLTLRYLKAHKWAHGPEKQFECTVCNKRFAVSNALKAHQRTHEGESTFECPVCSKRFSHNSSLITHRRRMHN